MVIILSEKEVRILADIMNTVEPNGFNKTKESLKDNKLVSYHVDGSGSVELYIKEEYMEEFMSAYSRFISLFIPQAKALYVSFNMFKKEAEQIVDKYTNKESEEEDNGES